MKESRSLELIHRIREQLAAEEAALEEAERSAFIAGRAAGVLARLREGTPASAKQRLPAARGR